jgi:rare lipoprotein A (peptidoglycan hydrolase)
MTLKQLWFVFFCVISLCSCTAIKSSTYCPLPGLDNTAQANEMGNSHINCKNYTENGVASWYGKRFNHKRTSSGERYNMYSMTAAHKTLPLSTLVRVTNLKNDRQVIVRVNDRGPYADNRVIDLSYAAAKKLKMVAAGTATVKIEALSAKKATA